MSFRSLDEFRNLLTNCTAHDAKILGQAEERNAQLTKPPGALGRLEDIALWYCSWRGSPKARVSSPQVIVFAGNHGVTAQGISAFPAEVTEQMVLNFRAGGAAINQLSSCFGAKLDVHALDLDHPTQDFTQGPAMSEDDCVAALRTGWESVDSNADLLVVGEMGIGNTTSAAAIALALFGGRGMDWAGRGTGLDDKGVELKASVIEQGIAQNPSASADGLEALRCLGGREIAAMAGAMVRGRDLSIPVILDGFICCSAAACLNAVSERALDHTISGHESAEQAHKSMLAHLDKSPLLSLGLRLGEGSGAALAIAIVKAALDCHSGMSTFAEAGVAAG